MRFYAIRRFRDNGSSEYWVLQNGYIHGSWVNNLIYDCLTPSLDYIELVFDTYFDSNEFKDARRVTYELTEVNPDKPVSLKDGCLIKKNPIKQGDFE